MILGHRKIALGLVLGAVMPGNCERCAPLPPPQAQNQAPSCALSSMADRVDMAFFVLSLHHRLEGGVSGVAPTDGQVEIAAKELRALWSNPDKLIVLMPAGPNLAGAIGTRTDVFRDKLSQQYGGYRFNYQVTGTFGCLMGAMTQAILTGKDWPLANYGCVTTKMPVALGMAPDYETFGNFLVTYAPDPSLSFRVLAAQTPGGGRNSKLVSKLSYMFDYGAKVKGSEPTFIAGDFNWPESDPGQVFGGSPGRELLGAGNWLNCGRVCREDGSVAFSLEGRARRTFGPPAKLQLFQLDGASRLVPVGVQLDAEGSENMHFSTLAHWPIGIHFRVMPSAVSIDKTCAYHD